MDLRFPGLHSCVSPHGDVIGSLNIMYSRWNLFFRFYSILKKKKKGKAQLRRQGKNGPGFRVSEVAPLYPEMKWKEVRQELECTERWSVKVLCPLSEWEVEWWLVPEVTEEPCPVHRGCAGRQVFRWGSWGPHWGLARWPQWGPQDPHLTAGGRVEWQHLGGTRWRFWKVSKG